MNHAQLTALRAIVDQVAPGYHIVDETKEDLYDQPFAIYRGTVMMGRACNYAGAREMVSILEGSAKRR